MMEGYEHISAPREVITGDGKAERVKLIEAGEHFWQALAHEETWPPELQAAAGRVIQELFRYGPIRESVAKMSEPQVLRTIEQLQGFAWEFLEG